MSATKETVSRYMAAYDRHDVVVAEGRVRTQRREGDVLHLVFCDVFELRDGVIGRLTSYLMPVPN